MGKPNGYEVPNPDAPKPESKKDKAAREKRKKKFLDAAFAYTPEQRLAYHERMPRHARFDDLRRVGGRSGTKRRAIDDASQE